MISRRQVRKARRPRTAQHRALALTLLVAGLAIALGGVAYALQLGPLNDLGALGQGTGQTPAKAAIQKNAEPPLVATPLGPCGPGSHPQPGIDGRVPAGSAAKGLDCNISLVGHQGTEGGFKVLRYQDAHGHDCAFYDTTLLFPTNALNPGGGSSGVSVLDMSDPAHPVQTDSLKSLPMLSPHESLNLNERRGLLAAVNGNPATAPGLVSIYDVHADCRHPVLDSTAPVARFGHESGFSADGRTFWATGTATASITAIDVTDPKTPHAIWQGNIVAHGMTLSDDGNRAYVADPTGGDMLILDTSQIQARRPNPQVREISRVTWANASIPQNAIPFTENGKPYVLEFDEYTAGTLSPSGNQDAVGAAHIIDISNEAKPRVVANLRLQVNQPADHRAARAAGDPGTASPAQGYAAHYCNIPTETNPKVVACSFIASGLRVFDISELTHPKEIAYYVAPTKPRAQNGFMASDYAMSKPAFVPERREIWYTDGSTGFYVLRVAKDVWPTATPATPPGVARCNAARLIGSASATPSRHGLRLRATRRGTGKTYGVSLYRVSGRGLVLDPILVRRWAGRRTAVAWNGKARGIKDGYYVAVFGARSGTLADVRRVPALRRGGRFSALPSHVAGEHCRLLRQARAALPVWGGTNHAALRLSFRTLRSATVTVTVTRAGKLVHRFRVARTGLARHALRLPAARRAKGLYRVTMTARSGATRDTARFASRKI